MFVCFVCIICLPSLKYVFCGSPKCFLPNPESSASAEFSSVSQSCLTLATPGTAARQVSPASPTPRAYSNSCPLSRWCHPTISSSVIPFSSHLQSFPGSGSFQMSQCLAPYKYCQLAVEMALLSVSDRKKNVLFFSYF